MTAEAARRRTDAVVVALLVLLLAGCVAGIWRCVAIAPLRAPLNPDEGWNAYHAAAAMAGLGPYPPAGSLMANNYPPLSFYLVGWLGSLVGDFVFAGRIVSLVSFLFICGAIFAVALRLGGGRLEAAAASLLFAGFVLMFTDYVGMNDPQMLGQALQMAGLLVSAPSRSRKLGRDAAGAALMVAGLYVKHNLIALPLALLAWTALEDRGRAMRLAGFMLVLGAAGLLAFRLAFGFDLVPLLDSARVYSLAHFEHTFGVWLLLAAPMIVVTLAGAPGGGAGPRFCLVYALIGVGLGGFLCLGMGVSLNAMFDANIALALGSGLALGRLRAAGSGASGLARLAMLLVLAAPFVLGLAQLSSVRTFTPDFWLRPMRQETQAARADIAYLRAARGPAVCAQLSLCYWAGKPGIVDTFNLDQQVRTGARSAGPVLRLLGRHAFAVMQLDSPPSLPPSITAAVFRDYRVDRISPNGLFLVPKSGARDPPIVSEDPQFLPLDTPRLVLRAFAPGDWAAVHRYMSDPEVTRWLPSGRMTEQEVRVFAARNATAERTALAVVEKGSDALVGNMVFHPWFAPMTHEIGWVIARDRQGRGYATEAAEALLDCAFGPLGRHRVIATCQPENPASWRVTEKLGMRREGHFRQCILRPTGEWWDEYFYALLAEEHRAARRTAL